MRERPVAFAVAVAAVVILAAVAAPHLRLGYLPPSPNAGLTVMLSMPNDSVSSADLTSQWIVPIESAVRSLGDVTAMRARISEGSASIDVRFNARADADIKSARLSGELAAFRARLPAGGELIVWPANGSGQRPSEVIALPAASNARQALEDVRIVPGVRSARLFGVSRQETMIRLHRLAGSDLDEVREAIRSSLAPRALSLHARSSASASRIEEVPISIGGRVVSLPAIAEVSHVLPEPETIARVNGAPAVLLLVSRDEQVPLFSFSREVQRVVRPFGAIVLASDGDSMAQLLRRGAAGLAIISFFLGVAGIFFAGREGAIAGVYPLLAVTLLINVVRIAGLGVSATSIMVAAIAIAAFIPILFVNRGNAISLSFALSVPVAVALSPAPIPMTFGPLARFFACAAICAAIASAMTTVPRIRRMRASAWIARRALRAAGSVVLIKVTLATLIFSYFGDRLDPRDRSDAGNGTLAIRVTLPPAATLQQTVDSVQRIESSLRKYPEVARFWSFASAGSAWTTIELAPAANNASDLDRMRARLRSSLSLPSGALSIDEQQSAGVNLEEPLEDRPSIDESRSMYRLLIKGNDAELIRRTADDIANQLARQDMPTGPLRREWPAESARLELIPRAGMHPSVLASKLRSNTVAAAPLMLPDGTSARIVAAEAPASDEEIRQRADLASLFGDLDVRTAFVSGGTTRIDGRFVMPIVIRSREEHLKDIDRAISLLSLHNGVAIERPSLEKTNVSSLQTAAKIAFVPVMLGALAAIILSSLAGGIIVIASGAAGVACAALLHADAMTLFAIIVSFCCTAGIATLMLARCGTTDRSTYRTMRRTMMPLGIAAIVAALLPGITGGAAVALRDGWRSALIASAIVIGAGTISACCVAPLAMSLSRLALRRRAARAIAFEETKVWSEPGVPRLEVQNVTKHYGSFRALHRISFELEPGVTALLGPNGAGKTTLLRIMTGLLSPSRGRVSYRDRVLRDENQLAYRRFIGFLSQEFNAYSGLSAVDFLDYWALERGMNDERARREEIERLIALVGLSADADRRVRDFSGGMRQRIGIARALLGDPPILIVDEPTTGLDLEARIHFRELIAKLGADRVVIVSTHIVSDIEGVDARLLVLSNGALVYDGDSAGLIARAEGRVFALDAAESEARELAQQYRLTHRVRTAHGIHVRGVAAAGAGLPGVAVAPSLEEAYLSIALRETVRDRRAFAFLTGSVDRV